MGNCNNVESTSKPTLKSFFNSTPMPQSQRYILAFDFFNCKVIKNIFDQLGTCLVQIKDTTIFLRFSVTCFCFFVS